MPSSGLKGGAEIRELSRSQLTRRLSGLSGLSGTLAGGRRRRARLSARRWPGLSGGRTRAFLVESGREGLGAQLDPASGDVGHAVLDLDLHGLDLLDGFGGLLAAGAGQQAQ